MNLNLMKSFDKFSQSIREFTEKEEESRAFEDVQEELYEEPTIPELKKKLHEAQQEASSCREKEAIATERTRLYQTQVAVITSEVAKLRAELDTGSEERASLTKTIEDLKSTIEELEMKSISSSQDRLLFEETSKANLLLRESTIKATTEAVSLKAELKSSKDRESYLERAIEKFQEKLEGRVDEVNEVNEMCMSYQRQADAANGKAALLKGKLEESNAARSSLERMIDEIKAGKVEEEAEMIKGLGNASLEQKNKELREELEENKARVNELQEMFASIKADKEETTNKLLELTQKLKQKKYVETEKLNDLQLALNEVVEERDNISRTLDCTRKIVEDQRVELSSGLVRLQRQRDMVTKKELERQKSMSQFENEIDSKEELMDLMERHIKELEMKLEKSSVENKRKANGICDDEYLQVMVLQEKVKDLEHKLLASEARDKNKEKVKELEHKLLASETRNKDKEEVKELEHKLLTSEARNKDKEIENQKKMVSEPEKKKDGIKKKTRQIVGNWRTKSFRYARESTKCVCCLINGKQSMGQKFAIRVGFLAIFIGVLLLGRRILG